MANNRLFLVHAPSGKSICIGKRMGSGWYVGRGPLNTASLAELLDEFYDAIETDHIETQDDMVLEFEVGKEYVDKPNLIDTQLEIDND